MPHSRPQPSAVGSDAEVPSGAPGNALPFARLGDYQIVDRIGHGGMGAVYKGHDAALNRPVAIKVLPARLARNQEFVERFKAEASAAARLIHPNIIQIHFIGEDHGYHFFVMQYVEGESLAELLKRRGKLSIEETLATVEPALGALGAAHGQQMVHRDIKPGNILLDTPNQQVLLADFGLARSLQTPAAGNTATGAIVGTAEYISPEQGRGLTVDGRSDLYSLGVLMYRMVCGRLPFSADTAMALVFQHAYEKPPPVREIAPEVPPGLASIIERLLAKTPDDRYQAADEVLADLHAFKSRQQWRWLAEKQSTIVHLPLFEEAAPVLPEGLTEPAPPGWWEALQDHARTLFRRHAPEVLKQLQSTEQQVDGAVAWYERRERTLQQLVQEGESVLAGLQQVARDQRAAGEAADELDRQITGQQDQLEQIRLRQAQLVARLHELLNQRDILSARLRVVGAGAARTSLSRLSGRRAAAAGIGLSLLILATVWWLWKSPWTNDGKSRASSSAASAAPSHQQNDAGTVLLLTEVAQRPLLEFAGNGSQIAKVHPDPDGKVLTIARADGAIELLDMESGQVLKSLETGADVSTGVAISPNGQIVASVTANGSGSPSVTLRTWDVPRGESATIAEGLTSRVRPLAISENQGSVLALVSDGTSNQLVRWNLDTRAELDRQSIPEGELGACAVQGGGTWIAIARDGREVIVGHRGSDGNEVTFQTLPTSGTVLAFHPVERWLGVGGDDGTITLWDIDHARPVAKLRGEGRSIHGLTFDSTGRRLAVITEKDVRLWDLSLDYVRSVIPAADVGDASFRAFSTHLVTGSRQTGVQIWNARFETLEVDFARWLANVTKLHGEAEFESTIRPRLPFEQRYDPTTAVTRDGRLRARAPSSAMRRGPDGQMHPDTPDGDTIPRLEDARTSEILLRYGKENVLSIAISPEGRCVATGSWDGERGMGDVRLWDAHSGIELKRFIGHVHYAHSVAFSPDGTQLLSGGSATMHLWDVATARELGRFPVPIGSVERVTFSPDGRFGIASDPTPREGIRHVLVDLVTGEQLLQYNGPYAEIALSPRDILCDIRYGTIERLDNLLPSASLPPAVTPVSAPSPAADGSPIVNAKTASPSASMHVVQSQHKDRVIQTLSRAGIELRSGGMSQSFQQTLQSIAADLPEVQVTEDDARLQWNSIVLNPERTGIDAFKFKSPLAVPADMHWVFAVPESVGSWYILPARGAMAGFDSYDVDWNLDLEGAALPQASTAIFQALRGGRILPGREYILWNAPNRNEPFEMKLAIKLSPAGAHGGGNSLSSLAKVLGLELSYHSYEPAPEGLRKALGAAHFMSKNGRQMTQAFRHIMSAAWKMLPEIPVETELGGAVWNRVAPTESFRFHAVRFKSPLSVPADLHCALVTPFSSPPVCRVISNDDEPLEFAGSKLAVNVAFPDVSLAAENTAMFYSLPGGAIQPGREYLLSFYLETGALPDMDLAVRLSPAGSIPETTDAVSIAAAVGLLLPAVVSPDRADAAMQRCRRMFDQKTHTRIEFFRLLEFLLPTLPTLNVGSESGTWNQLALDTSKNLFSAYRLTPPGDEPANLYAVLAKPSSPKSGWWYATVGSNRWYNARSTIYPNARLEGRALPEANVCLFETIQGRSFVADDPVILCFAPEKSDALTMDVALRWSPEDYMPVAPSAWAIARILGVNLRPAPAPPGSRLLEGHRDAVGALAYSSDGSLLASASEDGSVRFWDPASGALLRNTVCHKPGVRNVTLSADGMRLATCGGDFHELIVWDAKTMDKIATIVTEERIDYASLSPDGRWLAGFDSGEEWDGGPRPGTVAVWNVETRQRTLLFHGRDPIFHCIQWIPESNTLIAAGGRRDPAGDFGRADMGVVRFFDPASGRQIRELTDDSGQWKVFAASSDGKRLAGVKYGCLLKVWELPTLHEIAAVAQDAANPGLAISFDGRLIANTNTDGTIRLWDGDTLRLRRVIRGQDQPVASLAFSPDGRTLSSGGFDASVRLWDLNHPDADQPPVVSPDPLTDSVDMKLVPIPPGKFLMGAPATYKLPEGYERNIESERPQHRVRITRPYYLAAHEVTVRQFRRFVDDTGYQTTAEGSGQGGEHIFASNQGFEHRPELNWKNPGFKQGDDHPVVQVSWHDAVAFCEWLSKKEGAHYRLPTEAEWEYACRAGSDTTYSFGDNAYYLKWCGNAADRGLREFYGRYDVAEFSTDGFTFTAPVGTYLPNAFGLYDMHGNVFEWCADWYGATYYAQMEETDPGGPKSGKERVQRGGCCFHQGVESRSFHRDLGPPEQAQSTLGFRVVREIP